MTDHDQLLARAADKLEAVARVYTDSEAMKLAKTLRAALATRPEPLWEGTVRDLLTLAANVSHCSPDARFVLYPAAAGSAIPEEDDGDG